MSHVFMPTINCVKEIDSDVGSLSADLDMADEYRSNTLLFVQGCLGLDDGEKAPTTIDAVIHSFKPIGDALREDCSAGKWRDDMYVR